MTRRFFFFCAALAGLALAGGGSLAVAQSTGPAFDCTKASGEIEDLICKDGQLAALDREMARIFAIARDSTFTNDADRKTLIATQRGWIKGRNDCWKAGVMPDCVKANYMSRISELRVGFVDVRKSDAGGASLGPQGLRCEGLDAIIALTLAKVDLPLLYATWADQFYVLELAPSGSGEKYQSLGDGSLVIWTKGNEALFSLKGQPDRSCTFDELGDTVSNIVQPSVPASGQAAWPEQLGAFGEGYPNPGDACRRLGETAFTNQFLDDSQILVGCPGDMESDAAKALLSDGKSRVVDKADGYTIITRPSSQPVDQ